MRINEPYDEQYGTCSYTHAWLRVMDENMDPDEVSGILSITPTEVQRVGEPWPNTKTGKIHKTSGWFLSTQGVLTSLDARHHLDWLLERMHGKREEFTMLRARGYLIDVCCRWDSKVGNGGPTLSPPQLLGFGQLDTEVWFDIYFDDPD